MTVETVKEHFYLSLKNEFDTETIDLLFRIYQEDRLACSPRSNDAKVDLSMDDLTTDLEALREGKPIQQVVGKAFFYNDSFLVNEHTLIPRPETEELIALIESDYPNSTPKQIIDLGTGTGCIPITLAKQFPASRVSALDISEEALEIARANARNLNVSITFIQQSLLEDIRLSKSYDLIVSNPPYIRDLEKLAMDSTVLDYEPHLALFVDDHDPLIFYRRICEFAQIHLTKDGRVYCEINQYLGPETKALFALYFKEVDLFKDISGNDRMVRGKGLRFKV